MQPLITPEMAVGFALVVSRVIGIFMSIPFLNTNFVPLNIRILLVLSLSFFFVKILPVQVSLEYFTLLTFFLLTVKEVVIGFLLGLSVSLFVAAFSYAAEIISYFMGLTIANVFDPAFGQISVFDRYFIALFYLLFFITGAYQVFIGSILKSFELIPVLEPINFDGFLFVLGKLPVIFYYGFKMAFPFALILFVINVALALVNRLIPQINVFIVGLPLQIFIGLASLTVGAAVLIYFGIRIIEDMVQTYLNTLGILGK
jgi:flagellar biosynthetic protein FliR